MGIRYLNKYFIEKCDNTECIQTIPFSELSGKKIVIDISIYLYKFSGENKLLENIYIMLSIFKYYNIIPIFVFDGKPPTEKKELLIQRREEKIIAEKEYLQLKNKLENIDVASNGMIDGCEKQKMITTMELLKKKCINITKEQIENVKAMIIDYGMTYYEAIGEADKLCALMEKENTVWGCLSDDMDMFIYGCKKVLRCLNLRDQTVVLYNTKQILEKLNISLKELKEICILSGTDYNINKQYNKHDLYKTLYYFKKYKSKNYKKLDFYNWLLENSNYIQDYESLKKIHNLFNLEIV
uniref:XPG N-terminal domain-containing protein n=1 Tax=viral metagenome TaxID=1070528 RepID=A0A6C0DL80_9ZZZZ